MKEDFIGKAIYVLKKIELLAKAASRPTITVITLAQVNHFCQKLNLESVI